MKDTAKDPTVKELDEARRKIRQADKQRCWEKINAVLGESGFALTAITVLQGNQIQHILDLVERSGP